MSIPYFLGQMVGTAAALGLTVFVLARIVRNVARRWFW